MYLSSYVSICLRLFTGLNKEVEWRQWFSGTQGRESLNKEVEWRQWFSGTQGGKFK